jgi:hypothetical protein
MVEQWKPFERENMDNPYRNLNGGLSLRKRKDMIRVIDAFPSKTEKNPEPCIETDPEDVYFAAGCMRLGLPVGDDEASSHFAVHKIPKDAFFGVHQAVFDIILNTPDQKHCMLVKAMTADVHIM